MNKFFCVAIAIFFCGCAALFNSKTDKVKIDSDPQGALVTVDGVTVGTTPTEVNLTVREDHKITFSKEGYAPRGVILATGVGGIWVLLDIFWFIVPVIIDAASCAWYELDSNEVKVKLEQFQ